MLELQSLNKKENKKKSLNFQLLKCVSFAPYCYLRPYSIIVNFEKWRYSLQNIADLYLVS